MALSGSWCGDARACKTLAGAREDCLPRRRRRRRALDADLSTLTLTGEDQADLPGELPGDDVTGVALLDALEALADLPDLLLGETPGADLAGIELPKGLLKSLDLFDDPLEGLELLEVLLEGLGLLGAWRRPGCCWICKYGRSVGFMA